MLLHCSAATATITPTVPVTVAAGHSLTLDATGYPVELRGPVMTRGHTTRLFTVDGGRLTLRHLTVEGSAVQGADGAAGADGLPGADGTSGTPGTPGGTGSPGGNGGAGQQAQGGAMFVARGAIVQIVDSAFYGNSATGGWGGAGGTGGSGGSGGYGEDFGWTSCSHGQPAGGDGGDGGRSGRGGPGGAGGQADGGAIYNAGRLTILSTAFYTNRAFGGRGGAGGEGGGKQIGGGDFGGNGGQGCGGASEDDPLGGNGGDAGNAGTAGPGGHGGTGGAARGGAIYNAASGALSIANVTFDSNLVEPELGSSGGWGGDASFGGWAGNGGTGVVPGKELWGMGGNGGNGTEGADAGMSGGVGSAQGAAIYNQGWLQVSRLRTSGNSARAADGAEGAGGGWGGDPGLAGMGNPDGVVGLPGDGGAGATGGNSGNARGGSIYTTTTMRADNQLTLTSDSVIPGTPGVGGAGGPVDTGANPGPDGAKGSRGVVDHPEIYGARTNGLTITTTDLPTAKVGRFYKASLTATRGTPPYRFTIPVGHLPRGLTIVGSKIQGTPRVTGARKITVFAADAGAKTQNAARVLKLTVTS